MRRLPVSVALLISAPSLSGCLSSEVGAGVTVLKPYHAPVEVRPQLRVGINPLQLTPGVMNRDADGSFGVVTELRHPLDEDGEAKSSIYVRGSGVVGRKELKDDAVLRTNVGGAARLSWDADHRLRPGLEPLMFTEVSQFSRENRDDHSGSVHTYGEMGVGIGVSGFFDPKAVGVSLGVLMRLPTGMMIPAEM